MVLKSLRRWMHHFLLSFSGKTNKQLNFENLLVWMYCNRRTILVGIYFILESYCFLVVLLSYYYFTNYESLLGRDQRLGDRIGSQKVSGEEPSGFLQSYSIYVTRLYY